MNQPYAKIIIWSLVIISLFIIQIVTYLAFGKAQLKKELLPDYFATLNHYSDSVFVRDFYTSDCGVSNRIYSSHHLLSDSNELKDKLNVHYAYFQNEENFSWNDSTEKKFNLVYETWTDRSEWFSLFGFFSARQTETLLTDMTYYYEREATYHWVLFFWIKTYERIHSTDIITMQKRRSIQKLKD